MALVQDPSFWRRFSMAVHQSKQSEKLPQVDNSPHEPHDPTETVYPGSLKHK